MFEWMKNKVNITAKRFLTLMMSLVMILTCIPTTAFASEAKAEDSYGMQVGKS